MSGAPAVALFGEAENSLLHRVFVDRTLEVFNPDEKAEVLQGLLVEVAESYSHCPRALKFSRLWNIDEISKNIAEPPVGVKEPGI